MQRTKTDKPRIEAIDLARGLALLAMAIYHFTWDLEFFGYVEAGTAATGGWKWFARSIATSFLFLVGFSLFLAHADGIRWRSFIKRLAMVAAAALAITVATWFAVPGAFIFHGILHQIAVASLAGLAFLRLPSLVTLAVAAFVVVAPIYLRADFFNHPALWWVGLSTSVPRSNDFVPYFPWFAATLAGIAAARYASRAGLLQRMARWPRPRGGALLHKAGQHSLLVYLVHQPVLIGMIWLFAQIMPAQTVDPARGFVNACHAQCESGRDGEFCSVYCLCVLDRVEGNAMMDQVMTNALDAETTARLQGFAEQCTVEALEFVAGADGEGAPAQSGTEE